MLNRSLVIISGKPEVLLRPTNRKRRLPFQLTQITIITFVLSLWLSTISAAAYEQSAQENFISIKEARGLQGEVVEVNGIVTVPSGAYASAISSGFAIQDDSAGIYIIDNTQDFLVGQTVSVKGVVGAENNQINIKMQQASLINGAPAQILNIVPQRVMSGDFGNNHRGSLVRARGKITEIQDQGKYGHKLTIEDDTGKLQVYISRSSELSTSIDLWKDGDTIDVVGFAGVYHDTFEILPRQQGDIKKVEFE
ncbi:MAG: hypothetical protein AAGJ37_11405 [Pseudomonadota bacterium]